jgi:hypothetical protein
MRMSAANFCQFRGMLWKSVIYFHGNIGASVLLPGAAQLLIGDSPRTSPLRELGIARQSLFTAFFPSSAGVLDDHVEGWFLGDGDPPPAEPEGLTSVAGLGLSQAWLPPPSCDGRQSGQPAESGSQAGAASEADAAQ